MEPIFLHPSILMLHLLVSWSAEDSSRGTSQLGLRISVHMVAILAGCQGTDGLPSDYIKFEEREGEKLLTSKGHCLVLLATRNAFT